MVELIVLLPGCRVSENGVVLSVRLNWRLTGARIGRRVMLLRHVDGEVRRFFRVKVLAPRRRKEEL